MTDDEDDGSQKLSRVPVGVIAVLETRSGFLIRWTRGKRIITGEISLTEWEAGTQIHLAVPKAGGATNKELDALRRQIASAVE